MNIVFHSSDTFVPILSVAIVSILINNKESDAITIYVIENDISNINKNKLKNIVQNYQRNIIFIPMPDINKDYALGLKMIKKIWSFDSYCRLFLGSILPQSVKKVLYLDSDIICNNSLKELYETNLGNNYCAGVIDCLGEKYYELFHLSKRSFYCNSGVILLDLEKWRKNNIEKEVSNYVKSKNGYVFFMEQSVLNVILQEKIKILHPKYNVYTLMVAFTNKNLYQLRHQKRYYLDKEIEKAIANPTIIHMTNCFYIKGRPWIKGNNHPFKQLFLKYREKTPWKNEPLFDENTSRLQKYLFSIVRLLPQSFVCTSIGYIYNVWRIKHIKKEYKSNN